MILEDKSMPFSCTLDIYKDLSNRLTITNHEDFSFCVYKAWVLQNNDINLNK